MNKTIISILCLNMAMSHAANRAERPAPSAPPSYEDAKRYGAISSAPRQEPSAPPSYQATMNDRASSLHEKEMADLQAEKTRLVKDKERLDGNLAECVAAREQAKEDLARARTEQQRKVGTLEARINATERSIANKDIALEVLRQENSNLRNRNTQLLNRPMVQMVHQDSAVELDLRRRNDALSRENGTHKARQESVESQARNNEREKLTLVNDRAGLVADLRALQREKDMLATTDKGHLSAQITALTKTKDEQKAELEQLRERLRNAWHSDSVKLVVLCGIVAGALINHIACTTPSSARASR